MIGSIALGQSLALQQRGQRPWLASFDFTGGALPAGATLTRASVGKRIDASGALVTEAADVARFDYDPVTLALRGLYVEPQRTNLLLRSGDLSNAAWTKSQATATATSLVETSGGTAHYAQQSPALVAGTEYTFSAVVSERVGSAKRYPYLLLPSAAFGALKAGVFNLVTLEALANAAAVPPVVAVAVVDQGRRRLRVSAIATANSASGVRLYLASALATGVPSYAGDAFSGLDVFHAQLEDGPTATSRIDTAGAAATRAADQLALDWGAKGIADGAYLVRYTFDDGSFQEANVTVASAALIVPVNFARTRLRRVDIAR